MKKIKFNTIGHVGEKDLNSNSSKQIKMNKLKQIIFVYENGWKGYNPKAFIERLKQEIKCHN